MVENAGGGIRTGDRAMFQNLVLRSRANSMIGNWGWDKLNVK